ncbi:MAG: hypothetical protein M3Z64_11240, partial [Verrucomicrobiota bacterium]|nr:hypothetical protein [Verrucomicrobiota bacterium]
MSTPEEKKALCFLCAALVLGSLAQEYRGRHPRALRPTESALRVRTPSRHRPPGPRSKPQAPTPAAE